MLRRFPLGNEKFEFITQLPLKNNWMILRECDTYLVTEKERRKFILQFSGLILSGYIVSHHLLKYYKYKLFVVC